MSKEMICVDNTDLEDILTEGKKYNVEVQDHNPTEDDEINLTPCIVIDDNKEETATLVSRFADV